MVQHLELGLDTFGDVTADAAGQLLPHAQVIRDVVEEAVLADQLGVDFIGVGEHHRGDFAISSPEVVLAGIAGRTNRIRLGSAVTVLSSDDPVRVFQRFATLDAISHGRAEVILGRGSFTESFPLFGYDLSQYEELFAEKLDLFAALDHAGARDLARQDPRGSDDATRLSHDRVRIAQDLDRRRRKSGVRRPCGSLWHADDASDHRRRPEAIRALRPTVPTHARETRQTRPPDRRSLAGAYVAQTDAQAKDELWPAFKIMRDRIGAERGWGPISRAEFDREADRGSLYCGSPDTVARRIAATAKTLGIARFDLKYSAGPLSHDKLLHSIELYGGKVIPLVRNMLA
jgi:alkanesulfonate monooxygenase SsuD/methylene tetrahydromethanopterin reductase-like flavin-dependent oxidoreductase (luciferase family)